MTISYSRKSAGYGVPIDENRPGQRLLPAYAVKMLKYLKINFGTDKSIGLDVDPTMDLLAHIIECVGILRDVNKVYRSKGSIASRSVGARFMYGLSAEIGNILLDSMSFTSDEEAIVETAASCYSTIAQCILNIFPEIASQETKLTGKLLIHHTAYKVSDCMAMNTLPLVYNAYPAGITCVDASGALPLHWATHNEGLESDKMLDYLISLQPAAVSKMDDDGYTPLHWAVNKPDPQPNVIRRLLDEYPEAAASACNNGTLPLHWCVSRESPNIEILSQLISVYPDAVRTFCSEGWLPIHRLVDRASPSFEVVNILYNIYPQSLLCSTTDGRLPLHLAIDNSEVSYDVVNFLIEACPEALEQTDDEGYLPLHILLEQEIIEVKVLELVLSKYQAASKILNKKGFLPLHCLVNNIVDNIIKSSSASIDRYSATNYCRLVSIIAQAHPLAVNQSVIERFPANEKADPTTWNGRWIEKEWSPLSLATDRGLNDIVDILTNPNARLPDIRQSQSSNMSVNSISGNILGPPVRSVQPFRPTQLPAINRGNVVGSTNLPQIEKIAPSSSSQQLSRIQSESANISGSDTEIFSPPPSNNYATKRNFVPKQINVGSPYPTTIASSENKDQKDVTSQPDANIKPNIEEGPSFHDEEERDKFEDLDQTNNSTSKVSKQEDDKISSEQLRESLVEENDNLSKLPGVIQKISSKDKIKMQEESDFETGNDEPVRVRKVRSNRDRNRGERRYRNESSNDEYGGGGEQRDPRQRERRRRDRRDGSRREDRERDRERRHRTRESDRSRGYSNNEQMFDRRDRSYRDERVNNRDRVERNAAEDIDRRDHLHRRERRREREKSRDENIEGDMNIIEEEQLLDVDQV